MLEKAGEAVGFGIAMAEDVAGAVKTAVGAAVTTVTEGLKKAPAATAPVKQVAKRAPAEKVAKKPLAKKAVKKGAIKTVGKKPTAKKATQKPQLRRHQRKRP